MQQMTVNQMNELNTYQLTGSSSVYNPFTKLRNFSLNFQKTQELRSDIHLLKALGAKDTPVLYPQLDADTTQKNLVSETDKLMVMGEHEEDKLKEFDLDFSADAFENKLFDENRWKGWDDERS